MYMYIKCKCHDSSNSIRAYYMIVYMYIVNLPFFSSIIRQDRQGLLYVHVVPHLTELWLTYPLCWPQQNATSDPLLHFSSSFTCVACTIDLGFSIIICHGDPHTVIPRIPYILNYKQRSPLLAQSLILAHCEHLSKHYKHSLYY